MAELILALDVPNADKALNIVESLRPNITWVKVGLELFIASAGTNLIEKLKHKGCKVFLDLKLYDIPNTVHNAVKSACDLQIDMLTLHVSGGKSMIERAIEAIRPVSNPPILLGVTALTSFADNEMPCIDMSVRNVVSSLAKCANEWGLHGIVCSGHEAKELSASYPNLYLVCPGIRLNGNNSNDQKRVMTPKQAVINGADFLVIGRPVLQSDNPEKTVLEILESIK